MIGVVLGLGTGKPRIGHRCYYYYNTIRRKFKIHHTQQVSMLEK